MSEPYTSRISLVDFLAVLPSGFYIVLSAALAVASVFNVESPTDTWIRLLSGPATWFLSVFAFLGAYAVGSVVRAMSVNSIERICLWPMRFCSWLIRVGASTANTKEDQAGFPYWSKLLNSRDQVRHHQSLLNELYLPSRKNREETNLNGEPSPVVFFDYMKMVLCTCCPEAFAYTQSLEGRVRFAAGMLLGSIVSILLTILAFFGMLAAIGCGRLWSWEWFTAIVSLLALSAVLWIILAVSLRRIRFEEANQVFLAYLAHGWKEESQSTGADAGSATRP